MLRVAFAGTFAARLEERVRALLGIPCDVIVDDETGIVSRLSEVDVLVTLTFTREMGGAARRLKLVQVPGAGLDRIDRSALPAGTWLANAYGHEVGIAEYVMGAMVALSRGFCRLDAHLRRGDWESQWAASAPPPALGAHDRTRLERRRGTRKGPTGGYQESRTWTAKRPGLWTALPIRWARPRIRRDS